MTELLTAAQMRAIEEAAMASGEVTGLELMERAGTGVVDAVFEEWPELAEGAHRAVVLCGPGNNGGDGFVVARLLSERGWSVGVFLFGNPEKLPPDAKTNYDRWSAIGPVGLTEDEEQGLSLYDDDEQNGPTDLYVDALFGTGLCRALSRETVVAERFVNVLNGTMSGAELWPFQGHKIVAIDVPTGLCSDSGRLLCEANGKHSAIAADLTVTFHQPRLGHVLYDGPRLCGALRVADIGLSSPSRSERQRYTTSVDADLRRPISDYHTQLEFQYLNKQTYARVRQGYVYRPVPAHKYSHGHALVLAGGPGKTGAARLAARAALRVGAGAVTLGAREGTEAEIAAHITAEMMVATGSEQALAFVLEDARINALCLGPGFGLMSDAAAILDELLANGYATADRRIVLDADALTLIAQDGARMADLNENMVLTPHTGEFQRLFPDLAARLTERPERGPAFSKVDATREAAVRSGAVVLFKGHDTVIAHPDGRCAVHAASYHRAAPWLATAGAGDVLAGFITGLLARGYLPMQAAKTAAWLHVECARSFGPGLIAEDLPDTLPQVLRALDA